MGCGLYMDVHVPAAITEGLRGRGVDVAHVAQHAGQQPHRPPRRLGLPEGHLVTRALPDVAEDRRRQR